MESPNYRVTEIARLDAAINLLASIRRDRLEATIREREANEPDSPARRGDGFGFRPSLDDVARRSYALSLSDSSDDTGNVSLENSDADSGSEAEDGTDVRAPTSRDDRDRSRRASDLLMTGEQMNAWKFPLPRNPTSFFPPRAYAYGKRRAKNRAFTERQFDSFTLSMPEYAPVDDDSPIYFVACEMYEAKDRTMRLARLTIEGEDGARVLDEIVRPTVPVRASHTEFSGVPRETLESAAFAFEDARRAIERLPRDAILCGIGMEHVLRALRTFHPHVIDVGILLSANGKRRGLKTLAEEMTGIELPGKSLDYPASIAIFRKLLSVYGGRGKRNRGNDSAPESQMVSRD